VHIFVIVHENIFITMLQTGGIAHFSHVLTKVPFSTVMLRQNIVKRWRLNMPDSVLRLHGVKYKLF